MCFSAAVHFVRGSHNGKADKRYRPDQTRQADPTADDSGARLAERLQRLALTFTSKKVQPKVGQRYSIFRKASLASSTVMRPRLARAAWMLWRTADTQTHHFQVNNRPDFPPSAPPRLPQAPPHLTTTTPTPLPTSSSPQAVSQRAADTGDAPAA